MQQKKLIKLIPEDTISTAQTATTTATSSLPSPPKSLFDSKNEVFTGKLEGFKNEKAKPDVFTVKSEYLTVKPEAVKPESLLVKRQPPSLQTSSVNNESREPRRGSAGGLHPPSPSRDSELHRNLESRRDSELKKYNISKKTAKRQRSTTPLPSTSTDSSFSHSPSESQQQPKRKRKVPSPLSEMTITIDDTSIGDTTDETSAGGVEVNLFNSKKERNKFLSKILLKSKKRIYKLAGCFLTPFLLLKLIMPDLPFF